jgi:hypothetical protein
MESFYIFKIKEREGKKLQHLSYKLNGLSWLGESYGYVGFKLSDKLTRRIKLAILEGSKPKKLLFINKILKKSKLVTQEQYTNFSWNILPIKDKYYSDRKYKEMPNAITKDNQENYKKGSGYQCGKGKTFCTKCRFTHKSYDYPMLNRDKQSKIKFKGVNKCQNCGAENSFVHLPSDVRIPKKNANEKVWKNFYKLFVDKKK